MLTSEKSLLKLERAGVPPPASWEGAASALPCVKEPRALPKWSVGKWAGHQAASVRLESPEPELHTDEHQDCLTHAALHAAPPLLSLVPGTSPAFSNDLHESVAQLCPTLCGPVDCSPPGSSVHMLLQARTLEWVAISFSRGSSQSGN